MTALGMGYQRTRGLSGEIAQAEVEPTDGCAQADVTGTTAHEASLAFCELIAFAEARGLDPHDLQGRARELAVTTPMSYVKAYERVRDEELARMDQRAQSQPETR